MRMRVVLPLLCCLFALSIPLKAQVIQNCRYEKHGERFYVYYDLKDTIKGRPINIDLFYSADSGGTFIGPLRNLRGDAGKDIQAGNGKRIIWDITAEKGAKLSDSLVFEVRVHEKRNAAYTEVVCGVRIDMVLVEGGSYTMGSASSEVGRNTDEVRHRVWLDDYYVSTTEVTVEQYLAFVQMTESHFPEWLEPGNSYNINSGTMDSAYYLNKGMALDHLNYPITGVSWLNAAAYCHWLSDITGRNYRLLTEAEWEFAARGGNQSRGTTYSGSDTLDLVGWYYNNSGNIAHPVAQLRPNELGLYDMSGNVWEWCSDWYTDYGRQSQVNPQGPAEGKYRVDRGGAWSTMAERCRVSYRLDDGQELRDFNLGFRIACEP